ncbi:MAG: DUF1638 domain-containing protein [Chloroflexota bacterium]
MAGAPGSLPSPADGGRPLRIRAIACDILLRPVDLAAATSPHIVDVVDLTAALHVAPATLRERIQEQIDAVPPGYDAIVLAYGLCGGATAGIVARDIPVVLTRAHDCITIFLGSRERYRAEFEATPGTYWYVADQVDRGNALKGWLLGDAARAEDAQATSAEYVRRYGEQNAAYLMETLGGWSERYERGAFLDTGLPASAAEARAQAEAEERGWRFEKVVADLRLVRDLVDGRWDDDRYQVLRPGETLRMTWDDAIMGPSAGAPDPAAASGDA